MATKYVHARMPGRDQVHLVPAARLELDDRFGDEAAFVRSMSGRIYALCGKSNVGWVVDPKGAVRCLRCWQKR